MAITKSELLQAVATASAGYFAANPMPPEKIEATIRTFVRALSAATGSELLLVDKKPAVPVEKALNETEITCLECGKSLRSLKVHLRTSHKLSPEQYRQKWGLPDTYPMMAPAASEVRSTASKLIQERVQADPTIWKGGKRKRTESTPA